VKNEVTYTDNWNKITINKKMGFWAKLPYVNNIYYKEVE